MTTATKNTTKRSSVAEHLVSKEIVRENVTYLDLKYRIRQ